LITVQRFRIQRFKVHGDPETVNASAIQEILNAERRSCKRQVKKSNPERGTLNLLTVI
jgi:hypothetical protein